jgi:hypothetical protein
MHTCQYVQKEGNALVEGVEVAASLGAEGGSAEL